MTDASGFALAQHAIGNEAIELALGALEAHADRLDRAPGPPRLEHVLFPRPAQLRRIADLGAVAVVQPSLVAEYGDDLLLARMPRGIETVPLRSLAEAGVELAGSSDYPVTPPSVLRAIEAGTTRRTAAGKLLAPEQALDVASLLRAYTVGSARALGVADSVGSLEPGKQADLVHLDRDPLAVDPARMSEVGVSGTWVAGRRAHPA